MATDRRKAKKEQRFNQRMQIKLSAVFAFVFVILIALLVRITLLITNEGDAYQRQVLSQQSYDSQSIPYRRGEITDRNGILLARSERVYNVIMDCREINSSRDYLQPTIDALVTIYGLDETKLRDKLSNEKTRDSQYQIILREISEEEKKAFEDYRNERADENLKEEAQEEFNATRTNIRGIWFESKYKRTYPYSNLGSTVIGFYTDYADNVTGIEKYYNNLLTGVNGRIFGYLNDDSEYERTTIDPEHGKNLELTLDMNIQKIVQDKINAFDVELGDKEHHNKGAEHVGVVVMDPDTGEILAMATNNEFDLNDPWDLTLNYTGAEIKNMSEQEYVEHLNEMWTNICVSYAFEPGSTFKPVTVSSALECGAVADGDEFYCDGGEFVTDTQINCDNIYGHGDETLEYAIVNSCNDALMQIAMKMGITNFINYQGLFNFGKRTGIDLPNEASGFVYTRESMAEVELSTCSFGQGFTCNMIQEIAAFSAVINGGYYYQPHVLRQVTNSDGSVEKTVDSLVLKQPISSQTSALLRRYLTTAVQEGTGRKSQVPGYLTGGKTGTAEKIDPTTGQRKKGSYILSFIGACPMDDPQVVIYVIVDEPNVPMQADSTYAQVLFRDIANEVFPYMGLYPTEEVTADLLYYLGLTYDDVVKSDVTEEQTFQVYDSYGTLYSDARINEDGVVVSSSGQPIAGVTVNSDGNVVDAYWNIIEIDHNISAVDILDPKADNPNIAAPPSSGTDDSTGTSWAGVTNEDLEDE